MVEAASAAAGVVPEFPLTEVTSQAAAERLRYLGSPSVRVDGRDVEPGADERETFVPACRIHRTDAGVTGRPAEEWLQAAFAR